MTDLVAKTGPTVLRNPPVIPKNRNQGIDALRFVLCFAVALLHIMPRSDVGAPPLWVVVMASICRGAVPFFFLASGFFSKIPDQLNRKLLSRPIIRIVPVYFAWMLIYYAIAIHASGHVPQIGLRELVTGGVALHLWFLPALAVAMIAVPISLVKLGRGATWLACLALAGINLAFVGYREVLHLPEISGTRAMIAPLLFLIGIELARRTPVLKVGTATIALVVAWALSLGEEYLLSHLSGTPVLSHSSVATTYIYGLAVFLFARALPTLKSVKILAGYGSISLGIYAAHLMFVPLFGVAIGGNTPGGALLAAAATLVAATILCILLDRFAITRLLVR